MCQLATLVLIVSMGLMSVCTVEENLLSVLLNTEIFLINIFPHQCSSRG